MKRAYYTIIYVYLIVFGSILTVQSMPAYPKPIEVTQPDGTKLTLLLKGDEYLHFAQSTDGYDLKQNKKGFYTYASRDSDGRLISGDVIARNVEDRSITDFTYLSTVKTNVTFSGTVLNTAFNKRMGLAPKDGVSLRSSTSIPLGLISDYPRTGNAKSLVILVNFADSVFKLQDTGSAFNDMLNLSGYNQNNHVGSVRDYYRFNSGGLFSPTFVVVGPVTISKPMAYYGANDADGNDLRPAKMVYEACKAADNLVDFANFDYDSDGYVDNVYIYYAGKGEADGGGDNTIWPHSWSLRESGDTLTLDGKKISAYACSGELNGQSGLMTGMGTFTHEYSHILGLPDMYDVDYEKYNGEAFDLNYWSLMAYGAYNNKSCTPPCLTILERYLLGWATPLELNSHQDVSVTDLGSTNNGYIIKTSDSGEYYLLENRQLNKNIWDAYLPYHGMLIYHIDLRTDAQLTVNYWGTPMTLTISDMWRRNVVNALAAHQCCDIEEADNAQLLYTGKNGYEYLSNIKGDPFPGTTSANNFSDNTAPSMKTWNGNFVGKPISAVTESNSVINFKFMDFTSPLMLPATLLKKYSFRANWQQSNYASGYYLDVFTVDSNTGDTTWLNGYKNFYLTNNYEELYDLDDQTTYKYLVRATIGTVTSLSSSAMSAETAKASDILAYSKNRIIVLKGMDKGGKVYIHSTDGRLVASANSNRIAVNDAGIYLITATFNGKEKHLKLFVH